MAFNYSPKITTEGLVLYLDAANQYSYVSGSTSWNDISRGGNNGTLVNGPTYNSANGGSIVFDGVDDYVNLFVLDSTNSFTIDFWFKNSANGIKVISGMYNGSGADWYIGVWSDNKFNFSFGSPSKRNLYSLNTVNNGSIQNATCIYNKSINSIFLYLNGILQSSSSSILSSVTQPGGNLTIGKFGDITSFPWPGNIYNYKIYNRALSATEVLQNYNATKTRFGLT
jgi:hypothetical protein